MLLRRRHFLHFKKCVDTGNQGRGIDDVAMSLARSGCGTGLGTVQHSMPHFAISILLRRA